VEQTLGLLRAIEVVGGLVMLAVTGLLLIRVVGVALRPLDRTPCTETCSSPTRARPPPPPRRPGRPSPLSDPRHQRRGPLYHDLSRRRTRRLARRRLPVTDEEALTWPPRSPATSTFTAPTPSTSRLNCAARDTDRSDHLPLDQGRGAEGTRFAPRLRGPRVGLRWTNKPKRRPNLKRTAGARHCHAKP